MILSDKQIETGDWTYTSFQISHLEANAELRKAGERIRELENELVLAEQLLNWIDAAIDGERVCDFAESFPLVMKVVDLYSRIRELEVKLRELVEAAEWRDECNALYSGMYQDWLCDDDEVSESQDWMESIFDISEAAETAYQAALNAAREG